jgi:hypothetical protein
MINGTTTTTTLPPATAYRPILAVLRDDLLTRSQEPSVRAMLESAWRKESTAQRTADPFEVWCRGRATQVAAAWVLSVVFVRTLEDRGYLARRRIAGEGADDSEQQFVSVAPFLSARDYLLTVFREVGSLPGAGEIFDVRHNPVWVFGPSSEAARKLIDFFRQVDDAGQLRMRYEGADTRFLGDLYQDLDEDVRSRYALLQTPEFVEEFILGETLDPAIRAFGLKEVKLIDPTCGSGHFLLGAFHRLLAAWKDEEPGTDVKVLAQRALAQVHGTDLNPYAVAIARFRLTMAFMQATGTTLLRDAPPLRLNLAVADSLLHGRSETQMGFAHVATPETRSTWGEDLFALEDEAEAMRILGQRYEAVVGNPPYITEKDPARRELYRKLYDSAAGKFALAAPFTERFFDLARDGGYVGLINANSFMKREFGKRLIEDVLPRYELAHVVDTSGAFIPGHGTPTVLLFGRNQRPSEASVVTVMGKRGEPTTPDDPANGLVWSSIRDHHREIGFENDYVSVAEVERERFAKHPWSLGGGGAAELKALLEQRAERNLGDIAESIGITAFTLEDEVYLADRASLLRKGVEDRYQRPMVIGEAIRDWSIADTPQAVFPYEQDFTPTSNESCLALKYLWQCRTNLANNFLFGGKTKVQGGLKWYEYGRLTSDKLRTPLSIAFAFVATHNHFVLDRGGKVFKQTAPIIKLPEGATEEDHLALLAYLNSSTACFWMKQVCFQKSSQNYVGDVRDKPERIHYEFSAAAVGKTPIPAASARMLAAARELTAIAEERQRLEPSLVIEELIETDEPPGTWNGRIQEAATTDRRLFGRMVVLQEELDWETYVVCGLCEPLPVPEDVLATAECNPEDRPFLWTERSHGSTLGMLASTWTARFDALRSSPDIGQIEQPLYKRPWLGKQGVFHRDAWSFEDKLALALREAIAAQVEKGLSLGTSPCSTRNLVGAIQAKVTTNALCEFAARSSSSDAERLIGDEVTGAAVPFLAALRHLPPGLEKRLAWERTWDLQRREDAGEDVGQIPVPPKYDQKDFRSPTYWQPRGKLDVPKERFISYPGCESDDDPSPLIGWAGWDHLQQAQALAGLYQRRKDEDGWGAERLTPMLAGLLELVPWLKQWHNEPDERFGGARAGDSFDAFVREQALQLGLTLEELRAWRPAQTTRGRAKKAAGAPKAKVNGPTPEAVVEAVQSLADEGDGTVAQTALAEALGVTSAAAGKLAGALVEEGKLELVSARPKKYRRGNW